MTRPLNGAYCFYCKRELSPSQPERETSFSFDHVVAQKDGGWKRVPCCRKCNLLKDDLPADYWFWFIRNHPRWWKEFKLPSQVKRIIMDYRMDMARQRAAGA